MTIILTLSTLVKIEHIQLSVYVCEYNSKMDDSRLFLNKIYYIQNCIANITNKLLSNVHKANMLKQNRN